MLISELGFRKIHHSILLFFSIFVLAGSVGSANGAVLGTYYASDYNILNGTYLSGSVPPSVTSVDADYFIVRSVRTDTSVNTYNPSEYALLGSTSWVLGSVSNLTSNDDVNMGFRSYFSGTDIEDYVDNNTSDVDSNTDKGTHSNFSAQQYDPDSIYDTLTEGNTSRVKGDWGITSSAFTSTGVHSSYRYMGGTSPDVDNMTVTKLYLRYSGIGTVAIALYTGGTLTDSTGATKRTEAYNVAVSTGWNEIDVPDYDWEKNTVTWIGWCHGGGNVYYSASSGDAGDFQSARGRWNQDTPLDADETNSMPTTPGSGSFSNYWYALNVEYETPNYEMDLEVQWTNADYDERNEELAIYVDKGSNTHSLDATGGYMIIGDGTPNWGSTTGTISFWVQWDSVSNRPWGQHDNMETRFSGSNLVVDWGAASSITSNTSFTVGKWYFIAIVWDENTGDLYLYVGDEDNAPAEDTHLSGWTDTVSNEGVAENNFMASRGGIDPTDGYGEELRYWNTSRSLAEIQGDYDTELTGSETNLGSYFKLNNNFDDIGPDNNDGSGSGSYLFSSDVSFDAAPSENIRVDVWSGTAWQNLFTDLTSGWNNASVSSYLTSSTFTIRFKGSIETGDKTQDTWNIDAVLLHTWTDQYTTEVEFTGSSNTYSLEQLNWTSDSAWTTGSVNVTIQLYNHTLENYPTSGNGYIAYTSSSIQNTDDTKYQLIMSYPQDFRNDTGGWKIKVKGVKSTVTEFDFKADLIEFKPTYYSEYIASTEFLFSSMTSNASTQLNFTIVSQCNISSVNVTVQIWNYSSSTYATSGEGHLPYTSIGPNETKILSINTNPQFFTSNGNAKIKITGVLATQNQFQQEINQVIIKVSTQTSSQPFDWFTTLLYVLPVVFVLPFLLVLGLKRRKTTKPHIERKPVAFSKSFGMTHQQMIGKKMLLEIDPKSDYQNALFNFVSEARNNGETLFIFTSMNSTLHSAVSRTENVKFLLTSLKTSRIQQINETETLLPAADLSVSLDAIVRYQKVEADKTVNMLFDNLSDVILTCGFEKTYKFMRFLLEAISSPKTTALFMFNPAAHDPTVSSSIRGLFQTHLAYTKRGPNVRTSF